MSNPKPRDICKCGDYREQHDANGPCRVCRAVKAPWDDCQTFRLAHAQDDGPYESKAQFLRSLSNQELTAYLKGGT